jgi:hypothetical protein
MRLACAPASASGERPRGKDLERMLGTQAFQCKWLLLRLTPLAAAARYGDLINHHEALVDIEPSSIATGFATNLRPGETRRSSIDLRSRQICVPFPLDPRAR